MFTGPLLFSLTASAVAFDFPFKKRSAATATCSGGVTQPTGFGSIATPDTASAFSVLPAFSLIAAAQATSVPSIYTNTFQGLSAAYSGGGYLGYISMQSYNASACAALCSAWS